MSGRAHRFYRLPDLPEQHQYTSCTVPYPSAPTSGPHLPHTPDVLDACRAHIVSWQSPPHLPRAYTRQCECTHEPFENGSVSTVVASLDVACGTRVTQSERVCESEDRSIRRGYEHVSNGSWGSSGRRERSSKEELSRCESGFDILISSELNIESSKSQSWLNENPTDLTSLFSILSPLLTSLDSTMSPPSSTASSTAAPSIHIEPLHNPGQVAMTVEPKIEMGHGKMGLGAKGFLMKKMAATG